MWRCSCSYCACCARYYVQLGALVQHLYLLLPCTLRWLLTGWGVRMMLQWVCASLLGDLPMRPGASMNEVNHVLLQLLI